MYLLVGLRARPALDRQRSVAPQISGQRVRDYRWENKYPTYTRRGLKKKLQPCILLSYHMYYEIP
jgi:hypothetical protein